MSDSDRYYILCLVNEENKIKGKEMCVNSVKDSSDKGFNISFIDEVKPTVFKETDDIMLDIISSVSEEGRMKVYPIRSDKDGNIR